MELFLVKDALDRLGMNLVSLEMPYLPYSRQDRVCYPGEASSLEKFIQLLSTSFKAFSTWDAHNPKAVNCYCGKYGVYWANIPASTFVAAIGLDKGIAVIAPDKGAVNRATQCARVLGSEHYVADKVRDPSDGSILSIKLSPKDLDLTDKTVLIVDDIIDGGRTFTELASVLKLNHNAGKVLLYATHGIFSNTLIDLKQHIDQIYVANSWIETELTKGYVKLVKFYDSENE